MMAQYDKARADYTAFADIQREAGVVISREEERLKEDINVRADADEDSDRRRKDELMRAIDVCATSHAAYPTNLLAQARGFIVQQSYLDTFPLPPPDMLEHLGPDFDPEGMILQFDTSDGRPSRRLPDLNLTPILIPVYIHAPYFSPSPSIKPPYSTRQEDPVSENETVESAIGNLFTSVAAFYGSQAHIFSAVRYDNERDSVVVVLTSRGRLFVIPRKTRIRDIIAGARWPHIEGAPAFEDLRKEPRASNDEIDGIELMKGWMMEFYVLTKENLEEL
jgi:hypothetical protein